MFISIKKVIKQTASALNLPLPLVEAVVNSQFAFVAAQFANPKFPLIRLEDLGKFMVKPDAVRFTWRTHRLTLEATGEMTPVLLEKFNKIAKMRYPSQAYYLSRKMKKRFGSWHYK